MLAKRGRKISIIKSKNMKIRTCKFGSSNKITIKKFHKLLSYLKEFGGCATILTDQNKDCSLNYVL